MLADQRQNGSCLIGWKDTLVRERVSRGLALRNQVFIPQWHKASGIWQKMKNGAHMKAIGRAINTKTISQRRVKKQFLRKSKNFAIANRRRLVCRDTLGLLMRMASSDWSVPLCDKAIGDEPHVC